MGNTKGEGHIFPPFGDWKTGKRYPDPKKTDHEQIAWEFLRRNPKYQQDWKMCQDLYTKFKFQNNKTKLEVWICNPERLDNETIKEYFLRISSDVDNLNEDGRIDWNKIHPQPDVVAYSWGLEEMLDPTRSEHKIFGFVNRATISTQWISIGGTRTISMEPYETFIIFDLRKDIKTSMRIAERDLKSLQKAHKKEIQMHVDPDLINKRKRPPNDEYWIEILRILDANQSGATDSEIHSANITNTQNLRVKFKRAKEFRDKDYRLLAEDISPQL